MSDLLFRSIVEKLRLPIIQAPMAGGPCSVEFVGSVLKEGLIGSFGFAYSKPETIGDELSKVRSIHKGPVNANFFMFNPLEAPAKADLDEAVLALQRLACLEQSAENESDGQKLFEDPEQKYSQAAAKAFFDDSAKKLFTPPFFPSLEAQLDTLWTSPPDLLSFHFGLPPSWVFKKAQQLQIPVLITASSIDEALAIDQSGASAIIAQGIEAGGHRGYFDPETLSDPLDGLPTLDLVEAMAKRVKLPVVAAGGIMQGGAIREALRRGACAVQMGTAFLACHESGASKEHKQLLTQEPHRGTVFTKAFSGRYARGLSNRFTEAMKDSPVLAFPQQNSLTGALRQRSAQIGNPEYQSLWAGTGYRYCRAESVKDLVDRLEAGYHAAEKRDR